MPRRKTKRRRSSHAFDTDGPLSNLPAYAKMAAWVGFPAAAAGFLIWFITTGQATRLEKMETSMVEVAQHLKDETDQGWIIVGVMQRVCLNTARTQEDRFACVASQGGRK